jgi:hypothetical protein
MNNSEGAFSFRESVWVKSPSGLAKTMRPSMPCTHDYVADVIKHYVLLVPLRCIENRLVDKARAGRPSLVLIAFPRLFFP